MVCLCFAACDLVVSSVVARHPKQRSITASLLAFQLSTVFGGKLHRSQQQLEIPSEESACFTLLDFSSPQATHTQTFFIVLSFHRNLVWGPRRLGVRCYCKSG